MEDDAVEHGADVLEGLVGGSERLEPSVQIVSVLLVRAGRVRVCLLVILEEEKPVTHIRRSQGGL